MRYFGRNRLFRPKKCIGRNFCFGRNFGFFQGPCFGFSVSAKNMFCLPTTLMSTQLREQPDVSPCRALLTLEDVRNQRVRRPISQIFCDVAFTSQMGLLLIQILKKAFEIILSNSISKPKQSKCKEFNSSKNRRRSLS